MSYQVLARKHRPKNFETLVGQEHVVRALTHALEAQRLHHAYLFTGTRGVGKTTLSRILAKSLNCVGPDGNAGITAHPCGVCDACVAIDSGRFVDYIEMDAASNRGVDEMAQLLEQAVYAPTNARFKVYMIDEVHMLTNHAFNSMLKTLEEPPEYVKFILATTDPQKIPVTVLSRCLQFNLKQMPANQIVTHLGDVLGQENIEFDPAALRLLAQGARGSMRDALSLTDQAIAYAAGRVTLEAVQGMLGALDQSYLMRLLNALANQQGVELLTIADEMASRSLSYSVALQDLGTLLHQIAVAQTVPSAVPDNVPDREEILRLATLLKPEEVQLFYQIAVHGRSELGLAPDEYAGFTMTLLRMLAFSTDEGSQAPLRATTVSTVRNPAVAVSPSTAPVSTSSPPLSPAQAVLAAARAGAKSTGLSSSAVVSNAPPPALQKKTEDYVKPAIVNILAPQAVVESVHSESATISSSDLNWPELAAQLPVRGVAQQLALQSELVSCTRDGNAMHIHLRVPIDTLRAPPHLDKLVTALTDHFKQSVRITTELGAVAKTANAKTQEEQRVRQNEAENTIQSDPFVQALMSEFSATVVPGSVKPI